MQTRSPENRKSKLCGRELSQGVSAMSTRGRRPTPTSLRVLRGNPSKRRLPEGEPKPSAAFPSCPPHLPTEAKKEWKQAAMLLMELGLLTKIDRAALAAYCVAWGRWVEAERALQQYGLMLKSANGFPMQIPYLAVANKALDQSRLPLASFGMSPASRTRVQAMTAPSPTESAWDAFDRMGS